MQVFSALISILFHVIWFEKVMLHILLLLILILYWKVHSIYSFSSVIEQKHTFYTFHTVICWPWRPQFCCYLAVGVFGEQFFVPEKIIFNRGALQPRESLHHSSFTWKMFQTRRPSKSGLGIETHKNHNLFFLVSTLLSFHSNWPKHVIIFFASKRGNYMHNKYNTFENCYF